MVIVSDDTSGAVVALSQATGAVVWKTVVATNIGVQITGSAIVMHGCVHVGVSSNQATLAAFTPGFVVDFRGSVVSLDGASGPTRFPKASPGLGPIRQQLSYDPVRDALFVNTGNTHSVPSAKRV